MHFQMEQPMPAVVTESFLMWKYILPYKRSY
jgi:hypothetical protein